MFFCVRWGFETTCTWGWGGGVRNMVPKNVTQNDKIQNQTSRKLSQIRKLSATNVSWNLFYFTKTV